MSRSASRRGLPAAAGVAAPSDRRFRRSEVRPDRRRAGRLALAALKWVAPGAVLVALMAWASNVVLTSSFLEVRRVTVAGNQRLSTGELQALVEDMRGQNIFKIDFAEYRKRVLDSPWVASVTISRVLPGTIDLRISERTPLAIARLGRQLYLVDDTGVIVDEYTAQYRDFDLPIVDGLLSTPETAGPLADADRMRLTNELLTALAGRQDLGRRVSQIDVSNAHDARVMFDDDAVWLHLGEERFVERINTYLELAPTMRERFPDMDYVDLRFDERVFIRARGRGGNLVHQTSAGAGTSRSPVE